MSPVLKRILQMRVILLSRFAAPGNLQARLISGEQLGIALAIRLPDTCAIGVRRQYVRPRMRRDTVAEATIGQDCPPDTISSPRRFRQYAGHALSDLGHEQVPGSGLPRSEERRVGKECR